MHKPHPLEYAVVQQPQPWFEEYFKHTHTRLWLNPDFQETLLNVTSTLFTPPEEKRK